MICTRNDPFVKLFFSLIIVIAMAACEPPTKTEQAQLLEAHLEVRENVQPTASNMRLMRYSEELENLADSWVRLCSFKPPLSPAYRGVVQNTIVISGIKPPITEGVCAWKKEAKQYNYYYNNCTGVCSHYTQLVWATTNEVGCAMHQCDDIIPGLQNPQYLIACDYKPGGNLKGQRPFKEGPSCSRCHKKEDCFRNQCVKKRKGHHERVAVPACVVYKD